MNRLVWLLPLLLAACGNNNGPSYYGIDGAGEWALDGICHDPRFEGSAAVDSRSEGRDATDCRALVDLGVVRVPDMESVFGDDSGDFAHDGECDDPFFHGEGMASILLNEDRGRDASDCRALYDSGNIRLR